jgi:hypothetical protein
MSKDDEREEQRLTNAEDTDHRHRAAADAGLRAAAAAATQKARRMVPGGMERQRQLLRPCFRQGAASRSQKGMVPGGLARERQLLHPVKRRLDDKPSILESQRNSPTIRRSYR